jgi:pimeloyl-ACP methyl ester carboxylesterase
MARRPVVLIHGYSDKGASFRPWMKLLRQAGYEATGLRICSYRTLVNELTIPDIAEALDRALQEEAGLKPEEEFDAIVHSTGMLVIRAWLSGYRTQPRRARLKHLIGLAPATFGSPLAHKGRSFLGALVKGSKNIFKPDFLEAGSGVLDALELASPYTWELAHRDLCGTEVVFDKTPDTAYPFILCGTEGYEGLAALANEDGTDGTVRWAGAALNTRKFVMDFTTADGTARRRVTTTRAKTPETPMIPLPGLNHGTILSKPTPLAIELVTSALKVDSAAAFDQWMDSAVKRTQAVWQRNLGMWQQFVVRAVDERSHPIRDWNLGLQTVRGERVNDFDVDVHVNRRDPAYRCFHVDLAEVGEHSDVRLRAVITAASNTEYVGYLAVPEVTKEEARGLPSGVFQGEIELKRTMGPDDITLFHPFTTTLIEIRLNREPLPPGVGIANTVLWWDKVPA